MFKRTLLAGLLIAALATTANAQGGYIKTGLGFSFSTPNSFGAQDDWTSNTSSTGGNFSRKALKGTFGGGFNFNLAGGYMFNEYVGAELDFNYLAGSKRSMYESTESDGDTYKSNGKMKSMILLAPSIVLTTGGESKLKPYARFGILLPLSAKIEMSEENNYKSGGSTPVSTVQTETIEVKMASSLGFVGGIGVNFAVNDKIAIYGELASNNLSLPTKKATLTAYERKDNGVVTGKLEDFKTINKETEYVKEYTQASNGYNSQTQNVDKARESLRQFMNISSIGLRFGVKIAFGSK